MQAVPRAVHRLLHEVSSCRGAPPDARPVGSRASVVHAIVGRRREVHVLAVVREVPARLEQASIEDLRRDDLFVAVVDVELADELDELVVDERAARQEERHRRRPLVEHEELELLAELSVVARARLLEHLQVRVELLLRRERRAVDALEHRVALVAAPVRARDARQLHDAEVLRSTARAGRCRGRATACRACRPCRAGRR